MRRKETKKHEHNFAQIPRSGTYQPYVRLDKVMGFCNRLIAGFQVWCSQEPRMIRKHFAYSWSPSCFSHPAMKNGRTPTVGNIPVFPTGIEALSRLENTIYEHRQIYLERVKYIFCSRNIYKVDNNQLGQSSHLNFTIVHVLVCSNTLKI